MKLSSCVIKGSRALLIAILTALLITGVALAFFVTIDTNDGNIDSAWPATPTITDADDVSETGLDILKFWVATDSTKSNFYFRAELDAQLALDTWLEARLDCDRDGILESTDVIVEYYFLDNVYTSTGTWSTWDYYTASDGEYITSNNYEWKSPTSGGNVNWSACKSGDINVDLVTYYNNGTTSNIIDQTDWRGLNTTTAVQMQDLDATSRQNTSIALLVVIGLIGITGFALWRQTRLSKH